jgi:hypothetical protein
MRPRPKRPYRNFEEFFKNRTSYLRKPSNGKCPCQHCGGAKQVFIDPPNGGFRRRINCCVCKGTGGGTKEAWRQAYRRVIDQWREIAEEYDRNKRVKREALKKLTKEEIEVLRSLGV